MNCDAEMNKALFESIGLEESEKANGNPFKKSSIHQLEFSSQVESNCLYIMVSESLSDFDGQTIDELKDDLFDSLENSMSEFDEWISERIGDSDLDKDYVDFGKGLHVMVWRLDSEEMANEKFSKKAINTLLKNGFKDMKNDAEFSGICD